MATLQKYQKYGYFPGLGLGFTWGTLVCLDFTRDQSTTKTSLTFVP